jgi:hypothetical protein
MFNVRFSEGGEYPFSYVYKNSEILLKKYNFLDSDKVLFYGFNSTLEAEAIECLKKLNKKNYYICHAGMSSIFDNSYEERNKNLKKFDVVAFSNRIRAEWENNFFENKIKFIHSNFPIEHSSYSKFDSISIEDKKYDIIYSGFIHSNFHIDFLKIMKKYNYIFTSLYKQSPIHLAKLNLLAPIFFRPEFLSYEQMLLKQAQSKISICSNVMYLNKDQYKKILGIKYIDRFPNFNEVLKQKILPEFKGRLFELPITKTLMLVHRDPWNIIEDYFEPEKDFIYFDNLKDLNHKIRLILNNYQDYWPVVLSAYEKIKTFTNKKMLEKLSTF